MEDLQSRGPVLLLLLVTLICSVSANVANIAGSLTAEYELINHNPGGSYYASIILTNHGSTPLGATGWSLYFCHENVVQFNRFNISNGEYLVTRRGGFVLSHVKGCMYKFTPSPVGFQAIDINQRRRLTFLAAASISGIYDIYPNIYVADNTQSALITNTNSYRNYVAPFNSIFQYTRDPPKDPVLPVSPLRSYAVLVNQTYPVLTPGDIIPTPLMKRATPNKLIIDSSWRLYTNIPRLIVDGLMEYVKRKLEMSESPNEITQNVILFELGNPPSFVENSDEWYNLTITPTYRYVRIVANTTAGLFNGFQTFLNIRKIKTTTSQNKVTEVPELVITDSPRFQHRGLLLDVASNFMPVPTVMKLLHIMALVKLNKLQLLLANDYAVRLEIDGMPTFHTVGSRRCHDESENSCLFSQLGSDPSGNGLGSGYYSIQDYLDILSLAKQLHIEIIPMWNFDSNMRASEIAMRAYSKATNDRTMDWSLPQLDKTSHLKQNMFRLGKVDPCAGETERFIRTIVATIKSYHAIADYPLKTFSVGGDDTDIPAWIDKCRLRNKDVTTGHPYVQTKLEFTKMLVRVAIENEVTLNAYDNQFTAFPTLCFNSTDCPDWMMPFNGSKWYPPNFDVSVTHRDPRVIFQNRLRLRGHNATANISDHENETKLKMFQRNGYKSIISTQDVLDLSVKEEPGPYVPGELPFGRSPIPVQHIFSMWPESMCCSRYECFPRTNPAGYMKLPLHPDPLCLEDPRAKGPIGMQASISTRKVRTESELFQLLFPRLFAVAERAWHRGNWENTVRLPIRNIHAARIAEIQDFQKFKAILGTHLLPMLDNERALYYMTPPGAVMRNITADLRDMRRAVSAKTEYPGFVAQIKTDKMSAFEDVVDNKVYDSLQTEFRTRNKQSTRHSRSEIVRTTFPDKYAREHMIIMHNLAANSSLEFPIQTRFRNQDDATGVNSYSIIHGLPLYFDRDFGEFFNKTGYQVFLQRKPVLIQHHVARMQQHQRQFLNGHGASGTRASNPNTRNAGGPVPMGANQNMMNAAGPVPMGTNPNMINRRQNVG
ncbi:putative beta-hexosaminidase [Pecten maximus]|uniref:putative beta-hexosaminidase n=1 Tax=Pecten maximus TaxID=6579 RepID=UPI001458C050|nr:putative beta-hexosaminidase [Pecten maximus]